MALEIDRRHDPESRVQPDLVTLRSVKVPHRVKAVPFSEAEDISSCAPVEIVEATAAPVAAAIAMLGLTLAVPRMSLLATEPPFAYADAS